MGAYSIFFCTVMLWGDNNYNPANIQFIPCFLLYPIGRIEGTIIAAACIYTDDYSLATYLLFHKVSNLLMVFM